MIALQKVYRYSLRFIRRSSLNLHILIVDYFIPHKNFTEQLDVYMVQMGPLWCKHGGYIATVVVQQWTFTRPFVLHSYDSYRGSSITC